MVTVLKRFIETNLFIAVAAVAFLWANILLLDFNKHVQIYLTLQVFFSTWFVYQLSRWIYFKNGIYANSEELVLQWFEKHPKINQLTILVSAIAAIIFTFFLKWKTILALGCIGLISVLYPVAIFKPFGIKTRLRDYPYVKIFLIALVWSETSVLLPALESDVVLYERRDVILTCIVQFIYILFITLPFDINDAKVDQHSNVKTIPVKFGIKTSKWICFSLGVLYAFGILVVFMIENWRSIANIYLNEWTIYLICLLLILLQAFTFYHSDTTKKWIIKLVYDGSMMIYFLILLFTTIK